MRFSRCLFIAALLVCCCVMTACPEANFNLAGESRLPRFVTLPPGLTRADVSVEMIYYIDRQGRSATFIAKDKTGRMLTKVKGTLRGSHPIHLNGPLKVNHKFQYPGYELVTVNGVTDIIEHRKAEPIFYVTDDPDVKKVMLDDDDPNRF